MQPPDSHSAITPADMRAARRHMYEQKRMLELRILGMVEEFTKNTGWEVIGVQGIAIDGKEFDPVNEIFIQVY